MISSLIESYIRAYAGKYLKNFTSDKLVVGLNTVKLTNLEVSTEHLWKFKVPFRPVRAFVGEISVDLSFVFGGKLEVSVKDVLFIFEKEQYDEVLNPQIILDSLQALISVVYFTAEYPFSLHTPNEGSNMIDLEGLHRIIDRVALNIENLHFRIEEMYTGLASSSSGDMMCLGAQIGKLQVRSATTKEITSEPDRFLNPSKFPFSVNKVVLLDEFLLYCKWDNPLLESEFGDITVDMVRSSMLGAGSEGVMLQPTGARITVAAAYQKGSLLLRPAKLHAEFQDVSFHFTNEQVMYLYHIVDFFREYPSRLQSLSRVVLMQPCPWGADRSLWVPHSVSHRARLRWGMIRRHIKSDWWRYTYSLREGSIRWRTWFEIWIHAARYVALRDILIYHVGYEAFYDELTHIYNYAVRENLKLYYSSAPLSTLDSGSANKGTGGIDVVYLKLAEQYLAAQLQAATSKSPPIMLDLEQDKDVIRALYALQLEYDAFLPYRIAAFCRRRAEEKYMRRVQRERIATLGDGVDGSQTVLLTNLSPLVVIPSTVSGARESMSKPVAVDAPTTYLFFSVIDISNLSPSFASALVQCQATTRLSWTSDDGESTVGGKKPYKVMTLGEGKVLSNRVSKMVYEAAAKTQGQNSPKTYVQSNQVFTMPLQDFVEAFQAYSDVAKVNQPEQTPEAWLQYICQDRQIIVEVTDRSMVSFTLGNVQIPLVSMHADLIASIKEGHALSDSYDVVDVSLGQNMGANASTKEKAVSLRVVTKLVTGTLEQLRMAARNFEEEMSVKMRERKPILERALLNTDSAASASVSSEDDEDCFILDPAQITVQDALLSCRLPSIKVLLSAVYSIPVELRSNVLAEQGVDLPRTQHLPFLSVSLNHIQGQVQVASNPLTMTVDGSFDYLSIQDIRSSPEGASSALPKFALTIPRTTAHFEINQISTLSRYLDGKWDQSCFEALSRYTLGSDPYHGEHGLPAWMEIFIPKPIMRAEDACEEINNTSASSRKSESQPQKTVIWRSRRPLAHLFHPQSKWSKVTGSLSRTHFTRVSDTPHAGDSEKIGDVKEPSSEYKLRFGDWYTLHPKYLNVAHRVHSWLTFSADRAESRKGDSTLKLPTQKLHVSATTSASVLDYSLVLTPNPVYLPSSHAPSASDKPILHAEPVTPATRLPGNASTAPAPAAGQPPAWLGWLVPNANANAKSSSSSAATAALPKHAPPSSSETHGTWESEKAQLLSLVAQLQNENSSLKKQLQSQGASI